MTKDEIREELAQYLIRTWGTLAPSVTRKGECILGTDDPHAIAETILESKCLKILAGELKVDFEKVFKGLNNCISMEAATALNQQSIIVPRGER